MLFDRSVMQEQTEQQASYDGSKLILAKDLSATGLYEGTQRVGMMLVDTASPSAAANFMFSNLVPGVKYKLLYQYIQNTSNGALSARINSDAGENYKTENQGYYNNTAFGGYNAANTDFFGDLTSQSTYYKHLIMDFESVSGNNKMVISQSFHFGYWNGNGYHSFRVGGIYTGANDLSTLLISTSAGTMTGTASLYKLN